MKKTILISIAILNFIFIQNPFQQATARVTSTEAEAIQNCAKGDKILDYYEKLESPQDPNRYLNAAKYYYYQASRLDLSNPNILVGHARVALHQNRLKDAKNVLMIALNYNEKNPRVNFYLGETFFRDGEFTQAIDFYKEAYSHGYRYNFNTNLRLGMCYDKLNEINLAKKHYQNALKIKPNNEEILKYLDNMNKIKTNKENFDAGENNSDTIKEEVITEEVLKNLNIQPNRNNTNSFNENL